MVGLPVDQRIGDRPVKLVVPRPNQPGVDPHPEQVMAKPVPLGGFVDQLVGEEGIALGVARDLPHPCSPLLPSDRFPDEQLVDLSFA